MDALLFGRPSLQRVDGAAPIVDRVKKKLKSRGQVNIPTPFADTVAGTGSAGAGGSSPHGPRSGKGSHAARGVKREAGLSGGNLRPTKQGRATVGNRSTGKSREDGAMASTRVNRIAANAHTQGKAAANGKSNAEPSAGAAAKDNAVADFVAALKDGLALSQDTANERRLRECYERFVAARAALEGQAKRHQA